MTFFLNIFTRVFVESTEDGDKLNSDFMFEDLNYNDILQIRESLSIKELYKILVWYDLEMNYNYVNGVSAHKNRVDGVLIVYKNLVEFNVCDTCCKECDNINDTISGPGDITNGTGIIKNIIIKKYSNSFSSEISSEYSSEESSEYSSEESSEYYEETESSDDKEHVYDICTCGDWACDGECGHASISLIKFLIDEQENSEQENNDQENNDQKNNDQENNDSLYDDDSSIDSSNDD